ncbi:uncharacterized protein ARMOST_20583 [Armillaria ostoyae]|uniref:Uncharacterized protein n=1 Tax=Armillaria ostoyae TaxID=47428 RepID=A0A284S7P7_ARMOS|nr:uncharacterized protein ARMOST_20583 [Armillaria ostoyae]
MLQSSSFLSDVDGARLRCLKIVYLGDSAVRNGYRQIGTVINGQHEEPWVSRRCLRVSRRRMRSLVIVNVWNMTHDPKTYQDPMVFDPTRFLARPKHVPERDPREIAFGFGRRIYRNVHARRGVPVQTYFPCRTLKC